MTSGSFHRVQPFPAMRRFLAAAAFLLAFAGAAHWVLPAGRYALDLALAQDDAARIADIELSRVLTPALVAGEIESALAAKDGELAASYVALADARGIEIAPALRARVTLANSTAMVAARGAGAFGKGFVTGEGEDLAGLAGAATGDLTVWGDVRDLGREALHWASGEPVDKLMVGLAGAGIVATGATYAAFGAPLTLRAGLSLIKGARRAGVVGARLAGDIAGALRGGRRVEAAATLADIGRAGSRAGTRATFAGLAHVDDAAGAGRLARLADVKGGQTLAIFKTLGRGALFVTEAIAKLAFWVIAAAINLFGLVSAFNAMVVAGVRPLWKRRRPTGQTGRRAPHAAMAVSAAALGAVSAAALGRPGLAL
ncbi:hypothetical protein [Ancylobacter amanitiformis]|uniref:Uncharacterized protein n=1 Tax=Ancylobacter amanitiformis TaxID=217069 RepID=A0ABU0LKQ3_9HYPH|nr:hypothetical protein [Ancylobacter amanitiformis]MDQ0509253.1 hypothetical protein [Ancylobacter amanitiformis]